MDCLRRTGSGSVCLVGCNSIGHHQDVFHGPLKRRNTGRNRRCCLGAAELFYEIVDPEVKGNREGVVLDIFC